MSRCQWLMSRGYHRGLQCGNEAIESVNHEGFFYHLCATHLGIAVAKQTCKESGVGAREIISEHGRWTRKGVCQVCFSPLPAREREGK